MIYKLQRSIKPLTNRKKERIIAKDGFVLFSVVRKQFQAIEKVITGSLVSISSSKVFTIIHLPHKGRKERWSTMAKKIFRSFGGKIWTVFAVLLMDFFITACGGGGGGTTTPPTTYTSNITCPNGSAKTGTSTVSQSAALDVATAQCAAPVLVSVTPSNSATGVAPDTFASLVVATDSILDPSSLTATNVTLKAGQTAVAGTVSADGTKGFKFTPSAKLMYAQVYNFVASVKDTLGKSLSVGSTFTMASVSCVSPLVPDSAGTSCVPPVCTLPAVWSGTACAVPPAQCTAPAVWTAGINACVTPIGTLVTGANFLPTECVTIGDSCWLASVANGTIKFVNSGAVQTGYNTRPIVFAFYKGKLSNGTIYYGVTPMFADSPAPSAFANQNVENGGNTDIVTEIKGSANGVNQNTSTGCYKRVWNGAGFGNSGVSCPI